ncbi:MAG: PadR family transcriptional regulator [Candidatus Hodarchaeales archaeon]
MTENDEIMTWLAREINQLSSSSTKLALLTIISKYQEEGLYGYLIGEKLYSATAGELDGTKATFYAILRRLQKEGLVETKLGESKIGPRRKYYYLTPLGERAYHALWENWKYYYNLLENLIEKPEM